MASRLDLLSRTMVRRVDHHCHLEIHDCAAFGISGRGLLDGSLVPHGHQSGAVMLAEGEIYSVGAWTSDTRPYGEAWPIVVDRWISGGAAAFAAVDGLFTLLRYDPHGPSGESLSLVNDRFGSRRLFVLDDGEATVFAADFAPLVAWLGDRCEIDRRFVEETTCFSAPLGGRTWAQHIRLLPSATSLTMSKGGTSQHGYWRWSSMPPEGTHRHRDAVERLHGLWGQAIGRRLHGTAVGQQLSGGLDSRLILGEASVRRREWLTVTYGEPGADEVRFAQQSAQAVEAQWLLLELPGEDWLERRVELSLETGGMIDLLNAHHAGFLPALRDRLHVDLSGYLGDVILGDKPVDNPLWLLYWASPVSLPLATAEARIKEDMGDLDTWAWLMETKWRRHINWWPHLAVNDIEVRKPFLDHAFLEYCLGLPGDMRSDSALHVRLLRRYYPALAKVPIQRTGVRPGASRYQYVAMGAVRHVYRRTQRAASSVGLPMKPWIRGAVDIGRWLSDPRVQDDIRQTLLASTARVRDHFDPSAIRDTLDDTFTRHRVAHEIVLNLYRVERVLQHVPTWQSAGGRV
jgi:asparagine synthetase B (glutamine-hydrolysing)